MFKGTILNSLLALALCAPLSAGAAPILSGSDLVGATGVVVGSNIYDVEFVDGSCASVYSGCDEATDFTFTTLAEADQASQALLDEVLVGIYDTEPELTEGCTALDRCFVTTAYGFYLLSGTTYGVDSAAARNVNTPDGSGDSISHSTMSTTHDHSEPTNGSAARVTFARWTLVGPASAPGPANVPEPGILGLFAIGLLGVRRVARRRS